MEPTSESRWELVKRVIDMTDPLDPEHTSLTEAAEMIREAGIVARQHTGMPADWFTPRTLAEWLLGSYLDIVNTQAWFAVDPWLSVASERLARAEASSP